MPSWAAPPALADTPRPNVLLICVDDLRPELASFGQPYIQSPNIDALAARGRPFVRHYVQAPTCGASRYAMLTGPYGPNANQAIFDRGAAAYRGNAQTLRTDTHRLVVHPGRSYELYDMRSAAGESHNLADTEPARVHALAKQLNARFAERVQAPR